MKQCSIAIAICMLVAGCERGSRSITGPSAPDIGPPAAIYTLAGRIVGVDGNPLQNASVELISDTTRTAVSDANGEYRFGNVGGRVTLRVFKDDDVKSEIVWVDRDITLNVQLVGLLVLRPGVTVKGRVNGPPCDPERWDAQAPCQFVYFSPPATGLYELQLTWDGSQTELDMRIDRTLNFGVTNNPNQIRATITGTAGIQTEIQIHSYYTPQDFELTATAK